jgi:protein-tyrosine phosphatase
VIDLRSRREHAFAPPHPFRGRAAGAVARYVPVPLVDETDEEAIRLIDGAPSRDAAYRLIIDRCRGQIAAVFRAIADAAEGAVVFHCHAGLDRTGLVAALLLDLVGGPAAVIAADYALSEARLGAFYEHYRAGIADPVALARFRRLTSPPELMVGVLADVAERYAGAEAYLFDAGASPAHLARVRARLVGD